MLMQGLHIQRNAPDEINENLLLKRNEFPTKRGEIYSVICCLNFKCYSQH